MNTKTILKFNSTKSVRPFAWLALAILAVGAFGNSVQAEVWLNETFEQYTVASPATAPTTASSPLLMLPVAYSTVISGNMAKYAKAAGANTGSLMYALSTGLNADGTGGTTRSQGYISFKILQNASSVGTIGANNYLSFRLGAKDINSLSSAAAAFIDLRFLQTTTLNFRPQIGGANNTTITISPTAVNNVKIWYNGTDVPWTYPEPTTGAATTLNANTYVVYVNNVLGVTSANGVLLPNSVTTLAAVTGPPAVAAVTSRNIGKIAFLATSSQGADFSVDDIYAADSAPVASGPTIDSPATASGQAGYPFSYTITSSGVTSPVYSTSSLPGGLSLLGGVISGTLPTTATLGRTDITLTATGTGGPATKTLALTITAPPTAAPTITSAATTSGNLTRAFTYQIATSTTSPSSTPTSYAIATGTLPAGLNLNTATGLISGTPSALTPDGGTQITYTATNPFGTSNAQTLTITIDPEPVSLWNNTGTDWDTASSWAGGVAPSSSSTGSPTDLVQFGNVGAGFNNVNLAATRGAAGVTFSAGANAYTFTATTTGRLTIGTGGMVNSSTATQTFNLGVDLANVSPAIWQSVAGGSLVFNNGIGLSLTSTSRVLQVAGAGNFTVNGPIANGGTASASSVTVNGTGTTTLAGNNTYDGLTTMNAVGGTLTLSGDNSGATGGVTLTAGTLNINNARALGSGTVTLTSGTINNTSGAAIVNAGNNAVTWGGDLVYGTAGNTTSTSNLNLGIGVVTTSTSRTMTFAGTGNTLTMGALNITAASSTSRTITVHGVGNTLNMGGLTLTANPNLAVTVDLAGTANIGVTGPILNSSVTTAFANGVRVIATGTTTFSGVNAYSGSTTVAKTATLNIPIGGSLANCGPTVVAGTGTSVGNSANLNLAGAAGAVQVGLNGYVRGGGSMTSLVVDSTGTVEVPLGSTWTTGGTISFAGTTTKVSVTGTPVSGNVYTLMTASQPITGTPTLAPTASTAGWGLRVTGNSLYLEEVGIINIGSGPSETYSTDNLITGSNPMTKRGAGTLILSAANDYTGGTIVEAGTLQIGNPYALGSSTTAGPVTLKGGTLKSTVDLDLARSTFTTTTVGEGNADYQAAYGAISNFVKYTGNNTTISGPVTLDVASQTTMTMFTLVGNNDANSLVTKIGAGTVKVLGGSTKLSGTALAANGNGSTVLGGWRIQEGTVWFSPSSNNGGGNGPITLAGGNAKFSKLQNSNGTFTGFEVPSDLRVESDGVIQYDPSPLTLLGQNNLGFNNLNIGSNTLEVATATSPIVGQSLPRVNFKSGILTGSATFNNPTTLDLALQAISGTGGFTKTGLGTVYLSDQPNQAAAFATLTSTMTVESIIVEYAGSGYTDAPEVTLVGGGATTQATARATINNGRVTSIAVLTPGVGYTSLPRVEIAAPPTVATANSYTGDTTVQEGKLNLNGTYATSVTVKSGAALQLDWLTPAEARCSIDQVSSKTTDYNANAGNAVVKDLFLTKSVGGYTPGATLNLTIEAPCKTDGTTLVPGGVAATATATVNSDGVISALTIQTGGSGYVISPRVTVPAPTVPTVVATTTGSINFESGAQLSVNNPPVGTGASCTLLTADGGILGAELPGLLNLPGYTLTKSSDGKSLILTDNREGPTFSADPTAAAITYGQSLAPSNLNLGSASVPGSFAWKNAGTSLPAGTSSQIVTFTPNDLTAYRPAEFTVSVTVSKASLTPVFSGSTSPTYDGTAKSLSATTTPATIVNLTYDGSDTAPTSVGIYSVVATISDANYEGSATTSLMIGRAAQTITFGSLPAVTNGAAPLNLAATASSGLEVSYASSDTSVATVSGSTVTILKAGSTIITASQAGDVNYNAAVAVPQTLTVNPAGTIYNDWLTANGGTASDAAFLDYVFGAATPGALPASLKPTVAVTGGNLVLTYYVRQGTLGLTVTAQTSANLATGAAGWGTSEVINGVGTTSTVNGVSVQQRTASVSVSGRNKFLRIQAVQAAP